MMAQPDLAWLCSAGGVTERGEGTGMAWYDSRRKLLQTKKDGGQRGKGKETAGTQGVKTGMGEEEWDRRWWRLYREGRGWGVFLASSSLGLIWTWSHVALAEAHFISVLMH